MNGKFFITTVAIVVAIACGLAGTAQSINTTATATVVATTHSSHQAQRMMATTTVPRTLATRSRAAGDWTWWGYRLDRWQTWAAATQSPSYVKAIIPGFGAYVYLQAWVWKLTAQNARMMNQCLGITWSGSGIIVGCP